jgi:hypothetical protein
MPQDQAGTVSICVHLPYWDFAHNEHGLLGHLLRCMRRSPQLFGKNGKKCFYL